MALIFHAKRAIVYAAVEVTPGTAIADATLFAAANVLVQAHDVSMETKPELAARKPMGPSQQSIADVAGQVPAGLKFAHRTFGSGTAGTAPAYGLLLKACWMSETVVASTSVTYSSSPVSTVSLTVGIGVLSEDGTTELRYVMSGVRGTWSMKADKILAPMFLSYDLTGAFQLSGGATTTPVGTLTYPTETATGIRFGIFAGTPTGLFAYQCDSFELDRGIKAIMATDTVNANGLLYAMLEDEDPVLKIGYRAVAKSVADEMNKYAIGTEFANSLQLGTTAGSILTVATNAHAQYKGYSQKAIGAAWGYEAQVNIHRTETSSASDGMSLQFK